MSYLVLARKYRPQVFEHLVGQEGVVGALRNAIEQKRVGHAFLFAGPRGVGKTSMARIFAKALNCEEGPTVRPCGQCEVCKGIESGHDVDVQEIDAATYSKVENIRDLRETIPYGTLRARSKILIIDEVHRLSPSAFDALLKTLEEPPSHVKFIFATTELRKVPETIVSRCQVFEFRRIEEDQIVKTLGEICKEEKIKADEILLRAIAQNSKGGLRDSLTLLDQLVAFAGKNPTLDDLEKATGLAKGKALQSLFERVIQGDRKGILEQLDRLCGQGSGEEEFLGQGIDLLRQLLVIRACGPESPFLGAMGEERKWLAKIADGLPPERIDRMLTIALSAREKIGFLAGNARALTELALLKMARTTDEIMVSELMVRLTELEERLSHGEPAAQRRGESFPTKANQDSSDTWKTFLEMLREGRRSLAEIFFRKGNAAGLSGDQYQVVVLDPTPLEKAMLRDKKNLEAAQKVLRRILGRAVSIGIDFRLGSGEMAAPPGKESSAVVQKALDLFEGKVVEN